MEVSVAGIKGYGSRKVLNSSSKVPQSIPGDAPVVVRKAVVRVYLQGLAIVGKSLLKVTHLYGTPCGRCQ